MSELSRRRFANGVLGITAAMYGNLLLKGDPTGQPSIPLSVLRKSLEPYTDVARDSSAPADTYPEHAQTIVESNSRIHHFPKAVAAFVVVHSGFISAQLSQIRENADTVHQSKDPGLKTINRLARGGLGSVEVHNGHMARLLSVLGKSSLTTLSYIESPDLYSSKTPRVSLAPPPNALQVSTVAQSGELEREVSYKDRTGSVVAEVQCPDTVFSSLREASIDTIYVAGEYAFNPWSKLPACLGTVALSYLEEGFRVRGVYNAVFPPALQEGISRRHPLAEAVYADAIPYDQALTIARQS